MSAEPTPARVARALPLEEGEEHIAHASGCYARGGLYWSTVSQLQPLFFAGVPLGKGNGHLNPAICCLNIVYTCSRNWGPNPPRREHSPFLA